MRHLQKLVVDRMAQLDLGQRETVRRAPELLGIAKLNRIVNGTYGGRRALSDGTVRGLALALELPVAKVEAAMEADLKVKAPPTYEIPMEKVQRLSPKGYRALLGTLDYLLSLDDGTDGE